MVFSTIQAYLEQEIRLAKIVKIEKLFVMSIRNTQASLTTAALHMSAKRPSIFLVVRKKIVAFWPPHIKNPFYQPCAKAIQSFSATNISRMSSCDVLHHKLYYVCNIKNTECSLKLQTELAQTFQDK